ncbi:5625_t:CDS:2 [Entrophospora sp. SA101]|nr:5625_t:CDS:2 [Entrophospora sp. SA101]CAJ0844199.1 12810_t:CDS:2 [Entrophospora sp. SA101]
MLNFFAFSTNNHSNYNNNKVTIASILLLLLILLIQLPSTYSVTREYDLTITYEPLKTDPSRLAIHVDEHGNKIDNGLADGVPFVNQWPTLPGETYLYEFKVDKQTGTYFYHSHWELSTITGHGAFIVKDKPPKIYGGFEDHQLTITTIANTTTSNNNNTPATIKKKEEPFIIMFSDLWAQSDETLAKGLMDPKNFTWVGPPSDLLINGNFLGDTVFLVEPKKTYRLRIIAATTLEAIVFGIYNHKMTIIEVDGSYVKPVTVDSLQVSPGERYSVLITTDQTPGDYNILSEIRLRNDTTTNSRDPRATLRYVISPPLPPSPKPLNVPTLPVPYPPPIKFEMLTDSEPMPKKSDRTLILSTNQDLTTTNVQSGTKIIRWSVNNNVFKDFKSPVLLDLISGARSRDVDWNALNSTTGYDKNRKTYPIRDGEVIDLVFQNTIGLSGGCDYHPWHLHGHKFWDIAFGPGTFPNGLNMKNVVEYPVARDTTLVYPGILTNGTKLGDGCGWRLVRFVADNPGVWAAHCHITPHMVMGMMTLLEEAIDKLPHIPSLSIKPTA